VQVLQLVFIGYFAGVVAGLSPCIVPVLPIVFVTWTSPLPNPSARQRRRRSFAIIAGLVLSFSTFTALGAELLSALNLPANLLHTVGIGVLVLFGFGLLIPRIGEWLERPFARFARPAPTGSRSGFTLGLGLGLVFVPCAGPVLAAVAVLGARHHASVASVLLSLFFGAGVATPLLFVALAGDRLIARSRRASDWSRRYRPVAGLTLLLMALAITFNLTASLQRALPGYTRALQHWVEGNGVASKQLRQLQGHSDRGSLATCQGIAAYSSMQSLAKCGLAPEFSGITAWRNTPGNTPLTMQGLRGHVVLVDFWTYSCINCQRSIPHVEAWSERYRRDGLVVIGVAAPEFAFEHVVANIVAGASSLHMTYPIAVDNNLATWSAYANQYWPAEYLIDATGTVRHVSYGEGNYADTERAIRSLLRSAHPGVTLAPATNVVDTRPRSSVSPETYLGTRRSHYLTNGFMTTGSTQTFAIPQFVSPQSYALGGTWHTGAEGITAVRHGQIRLNFVAKNVYLVLSGRGSVGVRLNGHQMAALDVRGFPTLYPVLALPNTQNGVVTLTVPSGVTAFAFTFG
jgi:cytochrome c biogenesis protein CcdA/thiol-disulfide isomerase/thioredoxin